MLLISDTGDCLSNRRTVSLPLTGKGCHNGKKTSEETFTNSASTLILDMWRISPDSCCVWVSGLSRTKQNQTNVLRNIYVPWTNTNMSQALIWTKRVVCGPFYFTYSHCIPLHDLLMLLLHFCSDVNTCNVLPNTQKSVVAYWNLGCTQNYLNYQLIISLSLKIFLQTV